jgi:NAD-dependent deacetylase
MAHRSSLPSDSAAQTAELLRRAVDRSGRITAVAGRDLCAQGGKPPLLAAADPWRDLRPDQLATPEAFARDPKQVWEWYAWQRELAAQAAPGPAHRVLAEIEGRADHFALITESIDGLHQRAGSRAVIELRGSLWRLRCEKEGALFTDTRVPVPELPPRCTCGAPLRPDVVWYGEAVPQEVVEEALEAATNCDLLLAVATSGLTQPAISLPIAAKRAGATAVEINPEPTRISWAMDALLRGRPEEVLPRLWPPG